MDEVRISLEPTADPSGESAAAPAPASSDDALDAYSQTVVAAVERVAPAVVRPRRRAIRFHRPLRDARGLFMSLPRDRRGKPAIARGARGAVVPGSVARRESGGGVATSFPA